MFFKFCILIAKSLGRNKVRTALTSLGVIVLVAIYSVVTSVTSSVKQRMASGAQTRLIVSERWTMPSRVPLRYIPEVAAQPGVNNWTTWNLSPGSLDENGSRDKQTVVIAMRPESVREMHSGLNVLSDELIEAWLKRKDGILVGTGLFKAMNWEIGQQITVFGGRFPPADVTYTIVGIMPPGDWSSSIFCRHDYYMDATGDREAVNCIWLDVDGEENAKTIAATLTKDYENRQPALKVETESAGVARFAARSTAILQIIDAVVLILLVNMTLILSNSISISVRERRVEMAVLKVIGFQPLQIALMIIGEAMLVGGIAAFLGTGVLCLLSMWTFDGTLKVQSWNAFFLQFPIPWTAALWSTLLGAGVGLTGSVLPAMAARKIKVSDVFARIA